MERYLGLIRENSFLNWTFSLFRSQLNDWWTRVVIYYWSKRYWRSPISRHLSLASTRFPFSSIDRSSERVNVATLSRFFDLSRIYIGARWCALECRLLLLSSRAFLRNHITLLPLVSSLGTMNEQDGDQYTRRDISPLCLIIRRLLRPKENLFRLSIPVSHPPTFSPTLFRRCVAGRTA